MDGSHHIQRGALEPAAPPGDASPGAAPRGAPSARRRARTTMLGQVSRLVQLALWWFFARVTFDRSAIDRLRDAAARGPLVYVLQTRSLFDYLYFNYAFLRHGLPLARWSNGRGTTLLRPLVDLVLTLVLRRRSRSAPGAQLVETLSSGEAALLFLERAQAGETANRVYSQHLIEQLVRAQSGLERPIQLVPLVVVWERRSEGFRPTLVDEVFGGRHNPGLFRKVLHTLKNIWQPFFMLGCPIVQVGPRVELTSAVGEEAARLAPGPIAEATRQSLLASLEQVRAVTVGPRFKRGAVIKREVLASPEFDAALIELATREGEALAKARKRARKNLDRIAADFSMLMIKFMSAVLTPLWSVIYDGLDVDERSLARVREAARDRRLVVIPSHKSHIDYLIISYIFYHHGLLPPHIAAGDNLDFPPVGGIFRRTGAFFMRRQFKGDALYAHCFRSYVGKLLVEGYPLEFFIEGGRSRTGKLLAPRFGMLRMVVDSFLQQPIEGLVIVPCSVSYERVIEAGGYQRELLGGEKKQENLGALLRSTKVLTSRYGRLHVAFGEPIDLGAYLARYGVDRGADDEALQGLTRRLGYRVIHEINATAALTPSALVSLVLLNHPRGAALDLEALGRDIGFVLRRALDKGIHLSASMRMALAIHRVRLTSTRAAEALSDEELDAIERLTTAQAPGRGAPRAPRWRTDAPPEAAELERRLGAAVAELTEEALHLLAQSKLVQVQVEGAGAGRRFLYRVPEQGRGELSYYKNTILHVLVPEALLAAALLEPGDEGEVMALAPLLARTRFVSELFKLEFVYEERAEFDNVFWRVFDDFVAQGWVRREDAGLRVTDAGRRPLGYLRRLIQTFLESYALAAAALGEVGGEAWVQDRELLDRLLRRGRAGYRAGQVRDIETLARPTLQNALRRFEAWGLLEQRSVERLRRPQRMLRLRPDAEAARGLLERRLRALLHGRAALNPDEGDAAWSAPLLDPQPRETRLVSGG